MRIIGLDEPGNQVEGEIAPDQVIGKHELTQESRHELQPDSGNKDDTMVEGEHKGDETQEPSRTEEQTLQEDTQQLLSKVGENSAVSKGLDTAPILPMLDRLQIGSESAEASKEQSEDLAITSGQTIPRDWLIARAQQKAVVKPPINLEDIFSRIGEIKSKARKSQRLTLGLTKTSKGTARFILLPHQ